MNRMGFTLLELMMVLIITAVLALSAYCIYSVPVLKTQQTAAKLDLLNLANFLEKYHQQNNTYEGFTIEAASFKQTAKNYKLLLQQIDADLFRLAAIPLIKIKEDDCDTFYLDQDANLSVSGKGKDCW